MRQPLHWEAASPSELATIRGVCLDIDDTLSTHGKLTSEAFSALWSPHEAGFLVVPITGRPAGWCDHFARFWPVHAIVGENGAFTFFMESGVRKKLETQSNGNDSKGCLLDLGKKIQARFPQARWASDQSYREYDLAIDICEDVPTWREEDVEALLRLCWNEGAKAKLSSIHVNTWFGDYDKRKGFEKWLDKGMPGATGMSLTQNSSLNQSKDQWLYIGDSPNDEPMFECFKYSVGVANIQKYLGRLKHAPLWITSGESGHGFSQMAKRLIECRQA